jgi:O-antigen/teichoic acid export membrane protein
MVARAALLVGGAKVIGGASMLLLNLWVARYLAPAEYGVFAMATTGLLLLDGMVGSAVDASVVRVAGEPGESPVGAGRAGLVLKVVAGVGLTVLAVAVLAATQRPDVARLAALVGIGGTGMLVLRSAQVHLQLEDRFGWYGAADLAYTSLRLGGVLAVLAQGAASAIALLVIYAVAPWCAAALFSVAAAREWGFATATRADLRAVSQVTAVTLTTTGVGALVARLDLFILAAAGTPHDVGIFAAASTLAQLPTWLGAYLAPAFSARILPYCRAGRMRSFLSGVQRLLTVAAVGAVIAGALVVPALTHRLLPGSYAPTVHIVPILLVAGAAGLVTFPLVLHTLLFLSPRTYVLMDLASLPIVVPLYLVAAREWGATGVAWVTSAAAVTKAVVAQAAAAAAVRRAESEPALAGIGAECGLERCV